MERTLNVLRTLLCQSLGLQRGNGLFGFEKESDSKEKAENERRNLQQNRRLKNMLEEERLEMDSMSNEGAEGGV